MDFNTIVEMITPEVHASLRRAVEIGKWADGVALTREQREQCLQAVIAWEARHLASEARTGYIDRVRTLAHRCAQGYLRQRERLGFPLLAAQ